jgi:hypothetical protein
MDPAMDIPTGILSSFDPSPDTLLDLIRKRIDDSMLGEIAEADYGEDARAHLEALRHIRDTGQVPAPMKWVPQEVLELIRWSEPEDPSWKPGSTGIRGHWMRAFACAALLRAHAEPAYAGYFDGENQNIAQLLASALILGRDVQASAGAFLAWRVRQLQVDEERPFFVFALLLLSVYFDRQRISEHDVSDLADWFTAEEARERGALGWMPPEKTRQGLLGLTYFDLKHHVWRSLARHSLAETRNLRSDAVRAKFVDVVSRVAASA